ncbi:MAG TPA: hypothetical protein VF979_03510, partial [Streptosporangiaceae bacterium]
QALPPQAGPRPGDRTFSQSSGPQFRAWPYTDDPSADAGDARDYRNAVPRASQPFRDELGGAGRRGTTPSNPRDDRQSSGPDWPVPARPPAGRSPSGAAPPAQWSGQSADALDDHAHAGDDRADYGQGGYDRNGSGRGGRHHSDPLPEPYERDSRYGSDWDSPERSLPDRSGRSRHGRPEPAHPASGWNPDDPLGLGDRGDDRHSTAGYELDRREPDSYQTRQYEVDRYTGDRYGTRSEPGQYGSDQYDNASHGRRARHGAGRSDSPSSWSGGGGGDELEPLPPPMGPSQAGSGRADAWRPGARGRSEPGHPYQGDESDGDDRGEYEGDTW